MDGFLHTLLAENLHQFYNLNNFVKLHSVLIIFWRVHMEMNLQQVMTQ